MLGFDKYIKLSINLLKDKYFSKTSYRKLYNYLKEIIIKQLAMKIKQIR